MPDQTRNGIEVEGLGLPRPQALERDRSHHYGEPTHDKEARPSLGCRGDLDASV